MPSLGQISRTPITGRPSSGGFIVGPDGNLIAQPAPPPPATPLQNQYKLYNSGVGQNAEDYRNIMSGYQSQLNATNQIPRLNYTAYTPESYSYTPTADYSGAYAQLKDLSETGGYTAQGINDLRERAISPIRSVYANANREVDRNRRLQGGFSPNYNAVKAKMARELSDQIANQVTNVNAGLAQNVAQNRLQAAPQLTQFAARESELENQARNQSAEERNRAQQFNITTPLEYGRFNAGLNNSALQALQGMTSLYGTTPALANLFGNQALNRAQFEELQNQNNQRNGLTALSTAIRGING